MQKPFSFQTDITFRASVTATDERPNGVLVTINLDELSEHEQPSKAMRLIAVIPPAVWAQGPDRIAPMLKLAIASEMNSCFILRSLERSGKVLVMPKSGVDDVVGVRVVPDQAGAQGTFGGIFESFGRTARVWLDHAASALSAVDGRPEGATNIGVGPIPSPFPYGPGKAARDAWFSAQNEFARGFVADLQRQIESLRVLVDMKTQTEVQRLARIASKLSELTGAEMPDGASAIRLEHWISGIQAINLRSASADVVRKAELATALRVAAVFYSKLGITMPMPSENDTVTSLAQGIADTAAAEIDRRDKACDEARWRFERVASEIERVSGENFGIPVRTDPLLEDYAIRWVSRMRKKMVSAEIMKAVILNGQISGIRDGVTTLKLWHQDERKSPIDAFWVGFGLCEQRVVEALRRSFDTGGSAIGEDVPDEQKLQKTPSEILLDMFETVEFSWDGSGTPVVFSAIRMLADDRIVGIIDGDAASVEARIHSLEFAQSKKLPVRKHWLSQNFRSSLRFLIESYEFCTARSNSEGRTCVTVTLKLDVHYEPLIEPESPQDPKPADVSAEVAAPASFTHNELCGYPHDFGLDCKRLRSQCRGVNVPHESVLPDNRTVGFTSECSGLFEKPTGKEVKWRFGQFAKIKTRQHMTDLEIAQSAAIFVTESTDIVRDGWVDGIDSQVILSKLGEEEPIAHDTHVHYAAALGFALGIKHAQGEESPTLDIVRFSCGTCATRYSAARDAIGAKNLLIRCAKCNARLEVTPLGAVVVERGTVPKSGTNESNNQPKAVRSIERLMDGELPVKGEPKLSPSRQGSVGLGTVFSAEDMFAPPVHPQARCFPLQPSAAVGQSFIHFEDLSDGTLVNSCSIPAYVVPADDDDTEGALAWNLMGYAEEYPGQAQTIMAKLERLSEAKAIVVVHVISKERENNGKGIDLTQPDDQIQRLRGRLVGTMVGPIFPSKRHAAYVGFNIYTTLIEAQDQASQPNGGSDAPGARRDMAPVTPRSQRDPDDLARIEAPPKNLRTLVEDAHELLSQYEPANLAMQPAYWATTKRPLLDPLLHRIRLLGNAWQKAAGKSTTPQSIAAEKQGQARKASFYAPITLEHERREIPELLFRGKPITPKDPEWAELVATVRVLEAQAFPLVQLTVTGPKDEVGANEMVALAASLERVSPIPIKLECVVTVDGPTLADVHVAAQMRPEDDETQVALNNVETLLRGTDVGSKEPEHAQTTDLEPGESVRVTATEDAFYDMVGEFEAREEDGRYRVRFMKHGGVSIVFARSEIEREPKLKMPRLDLATSLQPDPTANPPITEAEANMARKLDEEHRLNMPMIIGLDRVRESSDPIKREPPNVVFYDPNAPLSAIIDRDQLAARARDLVYAPAEPDTNRLIVPTNPELAELVVDKPAEDSNAHDDVPSRVGQKVRRRREALSHATHEIQSIESGEGGRFILKGITRFDLPLYQGREQMPNWVVVEEPPTNAPNVDQPE
jgi:predicted Zn finger-like uncharacterized protein